MIFEDENREFKREFTGDIKKSVIAFANCSGGTVFVGIEDDGAVCGVENIDYTMLQVVNTIRDSIRPDVSMFTDFNVVEIDGKNVLRIDVSQGTARPYYLSHKGIRSEGVFLRQGASNVPASEAAILKMIKETSGDCYEEARSIEQDLTFHKACDFFERKNVDFGTAQMKSLGLIGDDDNFTNLGFLLSDQCAHSIRLAAFDGSSKSVFRDRAEVSGSLFEQLEQAFSYIDMFNKTRSEFDGMFRQDIRDYPVEAVREALLNSIVHRDYGFSSSTLISIFDDRIEFVSVGGLVKGISIDDINLGVSALRNRKLAEIFYRLQLIEAYGTGILKIKECYKDSGLKPILETSDNAFKITLPNINFYRERSKKYGKWGLEVHDYEAPTYGGGKGDNKVIGNGAEAGNESGIGNKHGAALGLSVEEERKNKILEICKTKGFIVRKDVEEAFGLSQAGAINILRELTDEGVLVKTGKARSVRYSCP